MFDFGLPELIVIALITLLVVGPQDIPRVMFKIGRFMRAVSSQWSRVRDSLGDMMHEAELEEYRQQAKNMRQEIEDDLAQTFEPEKALDEDLRPAKKNNKKSGEANNE